MKVPNMIARPVNWWRERQMMDCNRLLRGQALTKFNYFERVPPRHRMSIAGFNDDPIYPIIHWWKGFEGILPDGGTAMPWLPHWPNEQKVFCGRPVGMNWPNYYRRTHCFQMLRILVQEDGIVHDTCIMSMLENRRSLP